MPPEQAWEPPDMPDYITISLAARILGVSRQAAHRIVRRGELPSALHIRGPGDGMVIVREDEARALAAGRTGSEVVQVLEEAS